MAASTKRVSSSQSEAAALVLSRALRFLKKNGTPFRDDLVRYILDDPGTLRMYSKLMMRIKKYKAAASVNLFKSGLTGVVNLAMSGANVDKHRIANVAGPKASWGTSAGAVTDRGSDTRTRDDHHGLNLSTALNRMGVDGGGASSMAHAQRPNRFFANKEHEKLFGEQYPGYFGGVRNLERSGDPRNVTALQRAIAESAQDYNAMNPATKAYFYAFCKARNVLP